MSTVPTQTTSAIIGLEEELELTIAQLLAESVSRSDISVQGDPGKLKKQYGVAFLSPEILQNTHPPVQEAWLKDDEGWVIGFSFALPVFVCLVIGVFVIADIRYNPDIWLYGILGLLVGLVPGYLNARRVKRKREKKLVAQEKQGGFVLWVTTHTPEQHEQVMSILQKHHTTSIRE